MDKWTTLTTTSEIHRGSLTKAMLELIGKDHG
jgi:hypothetical protein